MAAITSNVTVITEMMRGWMEAVPLESIVEQLTLNSVRNLAKQSLSIMSHFATTKWGGSQGFLPLVLSKAKISLIARDNTLDCKRLANPKLLNPKIRDNINGYKILHIQADQKVQCQ